MSGDISLMHVVVQVKNSRAGPARPQCVRHVVQPVLGQAPTTTRAGTSGASPGPPSEPCGPEVDRSFICSRFTTCPVMCTKTRCHATKWIISYGMRTAPTWAHVYWFMQNHAVRASYAPIPPPRDPYMLLLLVTRHETCRKSSKKNTKKY